MGVIVGRDKGPNKIVLPKSQISSQHALVVLNPDDTIVVEDLESSNGTFINGKRIKRAVLGAEDSLLLADVPVGYKWLKDEIARLGKMQRDDFTKEFAELRVVLQSYKDEIAAEKKKMGIKNGITRLGISLVPVISSFFIADQTVKYIIMCSSAPLFGVLSMFTPQNKKFEKMLEEKRDAFLIRYRCPKCNLTLGEQSWTVLAEQKSCGRCQANWIINTQ